jgi:ABC-type multidrug transport system ATPase subunit
MTDGARADDVIRVERLTVRFGSVVACSSVSLSVPRGAVYGLLGRAGAGKTTLVRCLLGQQTPDSGRVLLFGEDARRKRRRLARRIAVSARDLGGDRDLLILDDPGEAPSLSAGATAFVSTSAPALVETIATHIGILKNGRLVLDAPIGGLVAGLRRLRYVNQMTETRTAFGTELDEFHALSVQVRGWGIEAIVSNFDEAAFERFRAIDGVEDATAETLTLEEAFQALG